MDIDHYNHKYNRKGSIIFYTHHLLKVNNIISLKQACLDQNHGYYNEKLEAALDSGH